MAGLGITLIVRTRWWYWPAYYVGMFASILRLLSEKRAERYVAWLVNRGLRITVR
jgi:hypothetical protein